MTVSTAYAIPGRGTFFTAPKNTPLPTGGIAAFTLLGTAPADWDNFGHTSEENTPELSVDGGDATALGSWLQANLYTIYETTTWSLTGNSIQLDKVTLKKIYNGWDTADGKGVVVPAAKRGQELALVMLASHDSGKFGLYIPNVNFTYGDAPAVDRETFMEVPFSATFQAADESVIPLSPDGEPGLFEIYGPEAFVSGS
ncbi:phage tail tube protein [Puerhibacterium puerhi]|uniref:phage tail tube protein n=1 Tax=Puerhibacterium puerhi TaxID=2692623 RepID=UPI0013594CD1|nr:hypothetical protein [Puerhibacterium puerhi]